MSQVVPLGKINQAYAVLATTNGRDKVGSSLTPPPLHTDNQVYRLVQYLSRLISWYLVRKGSIDTADRVIGLKNGLMQARRGQCPLPCDGPSVIDIFSAMRLLRNGEFFQAAIKLSQKPV